MGRLHPGLVLLQDRNDLFFHMPFAPHRLVPSQDQTPVRRGSIQGGNANRKRLTALRHHECRVDETSSAPLSRSSLATSSTLAAESRRATKPFFSSGGCCGSMCQWPVKRMHSDCFKHTTCRNRLAPSLTVGDVLFRKMVSDAFPLIIRQSNHPKHIPDRIRSPILM
jgi:hypothetical protein